LVRLFDVPCFVFSRLSLFNFQGPFRSRSRDSLISISHLLPLVNTFFSFFQKSFSTFFRSSLCNILFFLPRSCGAFLYYHFCFHLSTVFLQFLIFFCSFVIFNNKNSRQLPRLCILQHLLCYFVLKTFESHIIDNKFTI
jgi:hypothetical protein